MFCSFPGCDNPKSPKAAKGLCNSHYWQLHKGRELTPLSYRRNVTEPWLLEHVDHDGDECLIWPFQRLQDSGAAAVKWKGKQTVAARVMCQLVHGTPPSPKHEAAHSCGNGHKGCVNPKHLRWATHAENEADKLIHGTRVRGEQMYNAKLTVKDVLEIRSLAGKISQSKMGARYGVNQAVISSVVRRKTWAHV